jgi:hypothetical protein
MCTCMYACMCICMCICMPCLFGDGVKKETEGHQTSSCLLFSTCCSTLISGAHQNRVIVEVGSMGNRGKDINRNAGTRVARWFYILVAR